MIKDERARRLPWWPVLAAAGLAGHVALVVRQFPWRIFVREEIPLKGDVYRYFPTAEAAAQAGGIFGYDPYFMAGYPVGLWNSIGKKGFEILHLLLPPVPLPRLFYGTLVGVATLAPIVAWLGIRRRCEEQAGFKWLVLAVLLIYWHLDTQLAYFWGFGNVFFPAAACLGIVAVALAQDLLTQPAPVWRGALLGVVLAAIFYMHTVVLAALIGSLVYLAAVHRRVFATRPVWAAVGLAAATCLALAVWWLVPLLLTADDCVPQPHPWLQSSWKHLLMDLFSDRAYRHHFDRNLLFRCALVFGILGVIRGWRTQPLVAPMAVGGLWCTFIAYAGSYLGPVAALQPYRFLIPAVLFMLVPATVGGAWIARVCLAANAEMRVAAAALVLAILPSVSGYVLDLAWNRPACGLNRRQQQVLTWVRELPGTGRILTDDRSVSHVIPHFCRRAVIGGLSTQAFLKHRFAGSDDYGRLFGRKCTEWTAAELKPYLDAYGIEYALFSRFDWIAFAQREPQIFEPVGRLDSWHVFRIRDAKPSLVLEGDAEARADYQEIRITHCRSTTLVLKLHYADWLQADQGVRVLPQKVLNDPIPFLRLSVPAGVAEFRVRKRRGWLPRA